MVQRTVRRNLVVVLRLMSLLLLFTLVACQPSPSAPTSAPAKPPEKPAAAAPPTTAPAPQATTAPAAPAAKPAEPAPAKPATGDRLVIAVSQWGIETPLPWRQSLSEKPLWDVIYDPLIMRDPKTFQYKPGLATSWDHSADYKTWTFKLRQGVMFHENWGEMTSADVKFTVEQNLKPDAQGTDAPFFKASLDKIETPDKYTVVISFKTPTWEMPFHFSQVIGTQNITSKKQIETLGEEKAVQNPAGTGPYRHVEGRQGDYHRFEALSNHWRVTPAFKELVIRRVGDPAGRLAGIRAGEIDLGQVFGDYLDQAKKAGIRIQEVPNAGQYWIVLTGLTTPGRDDYCPKCPWAGDPNDPKSQENAKKVRLALNLAVNKQAIIDGLWRGAGSLTPFSYFYYPQYKGYSTDWKIPPYDPQRAKQLLVEAGYPNGFEVRVNPVVQTLAVDGPDVIEAVALDWERIGLTVKRAKEEWGSFLPKVRARKTNLTFWPYGSSTSEEASLAWGRTIGTKSALNILAEGPFDDALAAIAKETNPEKRAALTRDLGQRLYDGYYGIMLGMKSATWALSKKVGDWPSLAYTLWENNFEYITPAR